MSCTKKDTYSFLENSDHTKNETNHINSSIPLNGCKFATEKVDGKKSLIILLVVFFTSLTAMFYIYMMFPELESSEKDHMKIPWNIEDAKLLGKVLSRYKEQYYFEVMFGMIVVYIFLQTFAIPGSLFLSILSGFLFNFPTALTLVCFCSAAGASLCFLLSNLVGRRIIKYYWPKKIEEWSRHIIKHRDNLLGYILFLRMTPILPNWFINLAAPVIGVPLYEFALGTFLGVAPPSFIAIQAGKTLHTMSSSKDALPWSSVVILGICALLALLPGFLKKKLKFE